MDEVCVGFVCEIVIWNTIRPFLPPKDLLIKHSASTAIYIPSMSAPSHACKMSQSGAIYEGEGNYSIQ
jgi:hypothetical protein